ncbi:hypothetical protein ABHP49_004758 [Bacillus cereus]|uniref:hypothetical protein n=1 Tax=Bacillus cereus group TaxID=86661 RepID=UPI000278FC73|nr:MULTISPECIES: hypothetical protein [Bacillus cereus group]EJQ06658.1 hypothetical protein IE1_03284 [Bacillus cereus BAG3O-2]EJQ27943.1 hypothetical protein IE7_02052 [Bacillus cereus BAG4O-1]PEW38744.1 hypothetical protein CN436_24030 [Bacillus cereus]PFZ38008.1 hypothetical protein COL77_25995 [Bacillus wiedmannii]HDR8364017.1 hypothetical protein [Bacillus cereus]
MSELYIFLNKHTFDFIRYILPVLISSAALIVSITVYRQNKKRLDVTFEDKLEIANSIETDKAMLINDNGIYICHLAVVNPSPSDIAYFDLGIFDFNNNNVFETYNMLNLKRNYPDSTYFEYKTSHDILALKAPESNYGVFKSNSFTRLTIAFSPKSNVSSTDVTVTFKVAIEARKKHALSIKNLLSFKSFLINKRNKKINFKSYSKTYSLID